MDDLRLAAPVQMDSIVDGPGVRMVIWTQGCHHGCLGCHNPQTHDIHGGILVAQADVIKEIEQARLQTGLTLSGGEPFLQAKPLIPIVKAAKKRGWNIWAYSGFTIEELMAHPEQKSLLECIDVLVDGKFIKAQKDYRLKFKGSKNQRIIDVQASLLKQRLIYSSYDKENQLL